MNFVIQSSASDLMLHSIRRLYKYREATGIDFDILATVHDSVEVQCYKKDMAKVATLLKVVLPMTQDFKNMYNLDFIVPFEVDVEVGTSFGNLTEAEFGRSGSLENSSELESFIANA